MYVGYESREIGTGCQQDPFRSPVRVVTSRMNKVPADFKNCIAYPVIRPGAEIVRLSPLLVKLSLALMHGCRTLKLTHLVYKSLEPICLV